MNVLANTADVALQFDQLALERTVRALSKAGIRRAPLSLDRVKAWVKQFVTEPEKTLALLILRHLVYRSTPQLESGLRQALKQAALHYLGIAGLTQAARWQDALATKVDGLAFYCGPPTASWLATPGKSGEIVTRLVNRQYHIKKCYPHDVTKLTQDERYLVVDDGTYTGQQLIDFLTGWFDDYRTGQVSVVVGLAHQRAVDSMQGRFPDVRVFSGELLTEKNGLQWLSARWLADGQWPHAGTPYQTYLELCQRKGPFEIDAPLGYGSLGLMVAYEHGIPDDSLQLLWDHSVRWVPLIDR